MHASQANSPAVLLLPLEALDTFGTLMQREGCGVDLPRMAFDRAYAFEQLARAHASGAEALRRLALRLFGVYERNGAPGTPH